MAGCKVYGVRFLVRLVAETTILGVWCIWQPVEANSPGIVAWLIVLLVGQALLSWVFCDLRG